MGCRCQEFTLIYNQNLRRFVTQPEVPGNMARQVPVRYDIQEMKPHRIGQTRPPGLEATQHHSAETAAFAVFEDHLGGTVALLKQALPLGLPHQRLPGNTFPALAGCLAPPSSKCVKKPFYHLSNCLL